MSSTRKLAAIMFTDIVGYTALMGKDERKAFDLLKVNREIQKPLIKQYHGIWIKELGDGVMASFHTVTDAVFCAAAIHQAAINVDGLQLRIGIHLGEVIFENNDVFGDGVNIASRLQVMASPGSTWVSEAVYKNLVNKKEIISEFIKEETLKNVIGPVKVYEITVKDIPGYFPDNIKPHKKRSRLTIPKRQRTILLTLFILTGTAILFFLFIQNLKGTKNSSQSSPAKSIAVLPFVNMSSNPEQEYFSDGITEDIITQVSKIGEIKVISRTAIMQYKGTKKTMKEIGKELDVATILEGSVRREGNQVRVVAQLINVQTNEHLWAETYDKDFTQIFVIQSNIAEQIASALKTKFTAPDKKQIEGKSAGNLNAYDFYLRGKFYFNENNRKGIDTSIIIFEQAVTLDPKFALGYAALALAYLEKFFSFEPQDKWREQAFVALEKALALDPDLPEAYFTRAKLLWIPENHFPHEQAVKALRHALSLRPNFKEASNHLSAIYSHIGLHDKALVEVQKAFVLNPLDMETVAQTGHQLYYQQKYKEMLAVFEKLPKDFGGAFNAGRKAEALLRLGRKNEAMLLVEKLLREYSNSDHSNSVAAMFYAANGEKEMVDQRIQVSIASGKNLGHFHHTAYNIGIAYALMNKQKEAIRWLQKTAEDGLPCYTLFANDPYLDNLRSDSEFRSLMATLKQQWEYYKANL